MTRGFERSGLYPAVVAASTLILPHAEGLARTVDPFTRESSREVTPDAR